MGDCGFLLGLVHLASFCIGVLSIALARFSPHELRQLTVRQMLVRKNIMTRICHSYQLLTCALFVSVSAKIFGAKNIKKYRSDEIEINGPAQFPDVMIVSEFMEPMVLGTIITPGMRTIHCG